MTIEMRARLVEVHGARGNQPVLRVNQWQTGVLLGAGKNRVEFEYRPTLFRIFVILNRITIVLFVGFLISAVPQSPLPLVNKH